MRVAAVVVALDRAADRAAQAAVEAQTRPVDEVLVRPSARDALDPAPPVADWLWLLAAGVVPEPGALQGLLAPLSSLGPLAAPALLSGKVVAADGALDPSAAPWHRLTDKETAVEATARRLVSIRAARYGSLLVHSDAIARHAPPRAGFAGAGDDLEWTGRILRDGRGYLVPQSVAIRRTPAGGAGAPRYRELRNRASMLRGDVWDGDERLWFGLMLARDVARGIRVRTTRR